MNNKRTRNYGGIIMVIVLGLLMFWVINSMTQTNTSSLKYSEMLNYFEKGQVSEFVLDFNDSTMEMTLTEDAVLPKELQLQRDVSSFFGAEQEESKGTTVVYTLPYAMQLLDNLERYSDIYYQKTGKVMTYDLLPATETPVWLTMLPFILLLVLGLGFIVYFMFAQGGGGRGVMSVGKAKVKDEGGSARKTTFDDVAGADEEKTELEEIVEFLKSPQKFNALGARIPHGVLLVGPPGTGKTLLGRACAGEAGVPFYSISGSDFVEMYVGVGASRVRDLFEKAKKTAPSIIFIDEIDAVGRQRGTGLGGGHDEREQTLNQLLVEMDGFAANEGVVVMAATNRVDVLDKALLRPGRFDRRVYVGLPDVKGRQEILAVHTRNKPLAPDVNLKTVAKSTAGFTGADLENLVNEAALLAAKRNRKAITQVDIEQASIKVVAGPEKKSRVVTDKEKRLTAYHEAGHAIATYCCDKTSPVHLITIIPRGQAGGFTMSLPEEDRNYVTKCEMEDEIVTLMGGRVAEQLVLHDISTGASNDLQRATNIARSMVTRYGFSDKLGPVVFGTDPEETFLGRDFASGRGYSETVAAEIDEEIRRLVEDGYAMCRDFLTQNIEKLHLVAKELMEREQLDGDEFKTLMEGGTLPPLPEVKTESAADADKDAPQADEADKPKKPRAPRKKATGAPETESADAPAEASKAKAADNAEQPAAEKSKRAPRKKAQPADDEGKAE